MCTNWSGGISFNLKAYCSVSPSDIALEMLNAIESHVRQLIVGGNISCIY